jgi:D-xylulose kinase
LRWDSDLSRESVIISVELGTTSCKTIFFTTDGEILAKNQRSYPSIYPEPNWVEQDPANWFSAVVETTRAGWDELRTTKMIQILGMAFTGQMHGILPVDRAGNALYNCLVLQDRRSLKQCREIGECISKSTIHEITGGILDPYICAPKIMWLKENKPALFKRTHKFLAPKDYIRNKITRTFVTDPLDASGTMLYDIQTHCWSEEILELLKIDIDVLPQIEESTALDGFVDNDFYSKTGIPEKTPIIVGAGDDIDVIGVGAINPGHATEHMGTTGEIGVVTDRPLVDPQGRIECYPHPLKHRWVVGAPTQAAGAALEWFKKAFYSSKNCNEMSEERIYDHIIVQSTKVPAGSEGLIFLPFLSGERAPIWNPAARGTFYGISFMHDNAFFAKAILEGVAYSLKSILEIIEDLGQPIHFILSSGGATKSVLWRQMRANIYGKEVITTNIEEAAALGNFILAAVGLGVYESIETAVSSLIKQVDVVYPEQKKTSSYQGLYQKY